MTTPPPPASTPVRSGHQRWVVCGLLFIATAINYMDRQVLGLLAPDLERRFGWSESTYANLVTAFQVAYVVGLAAAGPMLLRLGTRLGYALSVGVWSLAIAAHALASGTLGFAAARTVLGLGEAGNFPAAVKAVATWFPRRERALANGLFNAGSNIGAMVAPALVPWLVLVGDWRTPFLVLGIAGLLWLAAWWLLYAEPERSRRVDGAELAWIRQDAADPSAEAAAPTWRDLLRQPRTWGLMIGFACSAPVWWFWLFWLPKLLAATYHLELVSDGYRYGLTLVYAMTCVGSVAGGWMSSHLIGRGWDVGRARLATMLACAVLVLPVVAVPLVGSHWWACLLIGTAAAAHQGWAANLFALASDRFPRSAVATVTSLGLLAGTVASVAAAKTTGWVLDAGVGYTPLLIAAGCAYLAGLVPMRLLLARGRGAQGWTART